MDKQRDTKLRREVGPLRALFGCRHRNMSRPFTVEYRTVCRCLTCGAYRDLNMKTFIFEGKFYYLENDRNGRK